MNVRQDGPGPDAWEPWTPNGLMRVLSGCDVPWCVVGGWAIDLFLGHPTRPHADIEIAVPRACFSRIRNCLLEYDLYAVGGGERQRIFDEPFPPDKHQCWVLDRRAAKWRLDVMLEPGDRDTWVYRRAPAIVGPRDSFVLRDGTGIPFLAPQAVLLFKAASRAKDDADFENVLPHLSQDARTWLRDALAAHPSNRWAEKLR